MPFTRQFSWLFAQNATIAGVVFGLVIAGMACAVLVSVLRRRRGHGPSRLAEANRLEVGYVLALTGMVIFLIISSFAANASDSSDLPPAVRVQVTAFQWCWRFGYEGQPVTVTGQCQGGSLPTLVVPAGEPVQFDVTSVDVVHAFWLPYLKFKMYAYPGHISTFTATLYPHRPLARPLRAAVRPVPLPDGFLRPGGHARRVRSVPAGERRHAMTAEAKAAVYPSPAEQPRDGLPQWLLATDHKRIGLLTIGTALVLFLFNGAMALTMRAQLAQPDQHILSPQSYLQFMTMHGTGMISLTITPFAVGLGVYLVPLQVGAPRIAAPRAALCGYWLYVAGAVMLIWAFLAPQGASDGW